MKLLSKTVALVLVLILTCGVTSFASQTSRVEISKSNQIIKKSGFMPLEMLLKACDNLKDVDSFSFDSSLEADVTINALAEELKASLLLGTNGFYDAPEKLYIHYDVAMDYTEGSTTESLDEKGELYLDEDGSWYLKTNDSWENMGYFPYISDWNLYESYFYVNNNEPLSKYLIETFNEFAEYGDNIEIEGQKFYTVNFRINKENLQKMKKKLFSKGINSKILGIFPAAVRDQITLEDFADAMETLDQELEYFDLDLLITGYIDADNLLYNKISVAGNLYYDISIGEIKANANGYVKFFDYNKEMSDKKIKLPDSE